MQVPTIVPEDACATIISQKAHQNGQRNRHHRKGTHRTTRTPLSCLAGFEPCGTRVNAGIPLKGAYLAKMTV